MGAFFMKKSVQRYGISFSQKIFKKNIYADSELTVSKNNNL